MGVGRAEEINKKWKEGWKEVGKREREREIRIGEKK